MLAWAGRSIAPASAHPDAGLVKTITVWPECFGRDLLANFPVCLAFDSERSGNGRCHSTRFGYTSEHWAGFEIEEISRAGSALAAIVIDGVADAPLAFSQTARDTDRQGRQKTGFTKGSVYVRHGAKSEPATRDDLREFIDRRLEYIRAAWLDGLTKLATAPEDFELARVRETDEEGHPTRIQLTTDANAPIYGRLSHDETHPHRMTELLDQLRDRLPGEPRAKRVRRPLRAASQRDRREQPPAVLRSTEVCVDAIQRCFPRLG